jgi:Right handed beta helix region
MQSIKNRFFRYILTACFVMLFSLVYAATYYVATIGSNANAGTLSAPFATIQYGLNIAQAGDVVFVRSGTYTEKLVWSNSGTTINKIKLSNYSMETVVINGGSLPSTNMLLIQNKSNIEISGLIFENNYMQDAKGIYVVGQGTSIFIDKCVVRNVGWTTNPNADPFAPNPDGQAHGIIVNGRTTTGISNVRIERCKIHNIITGNSEAVTLVGNVSNFTLLKDTVHDTKNIGIVVAGHYSWAVDTGVNPTLNQTRSGTISQCVTYNNRRFSNLYAPAGIYSDGARDVSIFGNKSYQNGNGMSVGCENPGFVSRNIKVYNNIVYDNDNIGIYFGSNAAGSLIKQCTLKNNTFFNNGNLGMFYSEVSLQNGDSSSII